LEHNDYRAGRMTSVNIFINDFLFYSLRYFTGQSTVVAVINYLGTYKFNIGKLAKALGSMNF